MLLTMMASTATAWGQTRGEEVYSTCLFGGTHGTSGNYTSTWTATNGDFSWSVANGNTNNSNWNYVKFGRKNVESVGTVTTASAYIEAITKVDVTIDAITTNSVNSIKLYTSSDGSTWTVAGTYTKSTGTKSVSLSNPTANLYYKVEFDCASGSANGLVSVSKIEYYHSTGGNPTCATPIFNPEAGTYTSAQNVTISTTTGDATIYYTIDGTDPTTSSDVYESAIPVSSTTTIKAFAVADGYDNSSIASATYTIVTIEHAGTEEDPYTVADARAAIDAGTGITGVYATGIVSEIVEAYSATYHNISYNISSDGLTTSDQLQAFRGKSFNGADFTSADDIQVGATVVVYGNLKKYNSTYEFDSNNQLVTYQAPASPYITASDVEITYDTDADEIEYTINNPVSGGVLTASVPDGSWLTLGTVGATIPFTCSANNAANSRSAIVTLTYTYNTNQTVTKDVTVTQAGNPNYTMTIAEVRALTAGTTVATKGVVTSITESSGKKTAYMQDSTAGIVVYGAYETSVAIGDEIRVEGELTAYKGLVEIGTSNNAPTVTVLSQNNTITPAVKTIAEIDINIQAMLIRVENATVTTISGVNTTIAQGTNTIVVRNLTGVEVNNVISLTANVGWYDAAQLANPTDVQIAAVPTITLEQYTYDINADGGDAEIPVTTANLATEPQLAVVFYESDGVTTATYNWISANINGNGNIAGHIDENEGASRTAYFKVSGLANDNITTVYSNLVTINQAAPTAPSISFGTASMSLAAGGESDRKLSFDYSGLGNNPTFSINYYEQDGTTAATYNHDWLTATIDENKKLNITAGANDGEARTAYLKVYGEKNANVHAESNLVTINQEAGGTPSTSFTWDLSTDQTATATTTEMTWVSNYATMAVVKANATTNTNNYYPGTAGQSYTSTRFYKNSVLTIAPVAGYAITSVVFDATTNGYASALKNSTWTNATASMDEGNDVKVVTVTPIDETSEFSAVISGTCGFTAVTVNYVANNNPTINANDVSIAYDATEGMIEYSIINPVEGASLEAVPTHGGDVFNMGQAANGTVPFTCSVNPNATERTATVELRYTYNRATITKEVIITQAGAPATMYVVNFNLDDGTFVPNEDFPQDVVEKEAGTYTLPSATKAGYDFTGWNDGDQTYAAGDEYTVSADVDFTAQWTESTTTTGTIAFGSASGSTPINSTSVTGDDSLDNEWTITTVFSGETSFTQNANYSQVGASSKPATSITFTMTLPQQKTISAFEAKFGGFNGTAGDITLKVGNTTVGSGTLNGSTDVIVEATTTTEIGTVLTVTVTNIDKGVKCYYISYTLSPAPVVPVINPTANPIAYNATTGSIDYTIDNYETGTMTAASEADWISNIDVEEADDMGEVTFNVTANTSNESRSATVTLTFTYGDPATTVTKDVTVTQNGQPSITVTPATANVTFAGGAPEFAVTYESLEIASATDFDVEFYETSTSTTAGTQPAWITNAAITGNTTDGFTLTVTVAANDGAARDAYLKVYAAGDSDYIYSNIVTISQAAYTQLATYSLVTNVNQIVSGKHYLIASSATNGSAYAMGGQTSNNRSGVAVTIENGQISETEGVYEFVINTHETSSKDVEYYTIYDAAKPGYLYASSSSANQLKTTTTLNDNGKWTIEISDNSATITAQGTNSRKLMRYNPNNNSPIFACYATNTTTGNAPCLYVKDNDDNLEYYGTEITYPGTSIPDGGSITVGSGSVITVPNGFTNNSPDNILIEEGGQLIHEGDVAATVQKNVAAYTAKDGDGWYLIATPVETIDKSVVAGTNYDLFLYSEPDAMWYAHWDNPGFEELYRGQGYLYANAEDKTINYAGTMKATNANINIDLDYTSTLSDAVRGFNLVGNPFTRNLVLGDMKLGGANLTTYYVTNTDRTALQAITSDAYQIKPGEGFFVQATAASQQLSFNASSKDDIDFRYIKIVAGNENGYDNAYIQMGDCNTLRKMNIANKTEVYVMDGEDDYAAARVEELAGSMPVHFKAIADGEYTITIEAKYTDVYYMHLFDNFTGEDIDLMLEPSYTFHAAAEDAENRFLLVFDFNNHLSVNENYTNDVFAYQYGDEIIINGEGELQIFDVMGRMVLNTKVNGVQSFNVPSNGVYILRIIGNDIKTQKIVVK